MNANSQVFVENSLRPDHVARTAGESLLAKCGTRGLEGVVAKHRASIYRSGRSTSWVKVSAPPI